MLGDSREMKINVAKFYGTRKKIMTIKGHSCVGRREIALSLNYPANIRRSVWRQMYGKMKTLSSASLAIKAFSSLKLIRSCFFLKS